MKRQANQPEFASIYVAQLQSGLWRVETDDNEHYSLFETEEGADAYALYLESEYDKRGVDSGIFVG